ncbi:calcium uptake protein 3, mitochondrial isoform X4 [Apis cerana]|uniref:calcium uptake protein 3, mitochondrial isoform X4 n=1 Tax=Apis cerana TaxID=7461 RepID=UPI002B227125|nr:calcium uptake protein 3, mitochondrial isoform X4 [Apis cerana]
MANVVRLLRRISSSSRHFCGFTRSYSSRYNNSEIKKWNTGLFATFSIALLVGYKYLRPDIVHAKSRKKEDDAQKAVKLTMREKRFIKFASVEYDGQLYMTPQDFLDSVVESEPRRIISYTEYVFLLSILIKPKSGFRIAFNMFDTDGNERVDKTEFLVMEKVFSHAWRGRHGTETKENLNLLTERQKTPEAIQVQYIDDEQGLQRRHAVDTSLMIHFFGKDGKNELKYEDFTRFMENLQHEILELEFHEFSKGHDTISELDFAKILLRYTQLDTDEYDKYLDRIQINSDLRIGITFEEFRRFYQFLNNLDDFSIAMRMYTLADHPISKDEFQRAVKICTGSVLSRHIIDTVFALFDDDGDGQLSYTEFIAIMKDRLRRGFKSQRRLKNLKAFTSCIKQEMKSR